MDSKLSHVQVITSELTKSPKHLFCPSVSMLSLAISLRVICSLGCLLNVKHAACFAHEATSKANVTVTCKLIDCTMQPNTHA